MRNVAVSWEVLLRFLKGAGMVAHRRRWGCTEDARPFALGRGRIAESCRLSGDGVIEMPSFNPIIALRYGWSFLPIHPFVMCPSSAFGCA